MGGYPTGTLEVSRNLVPGMSAINIVGRNLAIGTSFTPITVDGALQMPLLGGEQPLRIRAGGNAADGAGGAGARRIALSGINANGDRFISTIATAGISASALTAASFFRLNEIFVIESGNYPADATAPAGNAGKIIIEDAGGNQWGAIDADGGVGRARSQKGLYHVPAGYNLYIDDLGFSTDASASRVDLIGMARVNNRTAAAPYTPFVTFFEKRDFANANEYRLLKPLGPFPGNTDVVFYARASAAGEEVSFSADGVLVQEAPFTDINGLSLEDIVE